MGLLKETMQAIIRIDKNLNYLCKGQDRAKIQSAFQATYQQKPIEQIRSDIRQKADNEVSLYDRLPRLEAFPYPSNLTLGGRFKAVRKFYGLLQGNVEENLCVTTGYISKIELDNAIPSETIIRLFSLQNCISEQWLATGQLPQTTEEPAKPIAMSKVTPLSGYEHEEDIPPEIMIDFGRDRGLLPVQRSPLVDKNISQENI